MCDLRIVVKVLLFCACFLAVTQSASAQGDCCSDNGSPECEDEVTPLLWTVYGFRIKPHLSASIHS